jgi:hypothetical protein
MYFLKTKISNFYLQYFLQIVYPNEAQFNIACIGIYSSYSLPLQLQA